MSPAIKYTLGRFGLFVLILALILPLPLNILVKAMIALVLSAALSYFLLADWRLQMAEQLSTVASRRTAEKERLRAALAGDEEAAAAGDRAAEPLGRATAEPLGRATAEPEGGVTAERAGREMAEPASRTTAEPAGAEAEQK